MFPRRRIAASLLYLLLIAAIPLNLVGCAMKVQAANLMESIEAKTVTGKTADNAFIASSADFAVKLFQKGIAENKNSLISPLSVMLALAMTANGADNTTKAQMEALLGGEIPLNKLNEYLCTYVKHLPSADKSKLKIANSIWFCDEENKLTVEPDFLQKNADYYNAAAYKSAFDNQTLKDINNWVNQNTDGLIDKILDEISNDAVMYLINAIVFDAQWENVYNKNDIHDGTFTSFDGKTQSVKMMRSLESKYISGEKATGFIKDYKNGSYSFVALLPNEDIDINDYIASLTGEGFINMMKNVQNTAVTAHLPKFSYDYTISMNNSLATLGMPTAFDPSDADFTKLGHSTSGNIFISEVLHKTFISVDELGTKAGAVTKVEMGLTSAMESKSVKLDRPFLYAIVDNATGLPVFIGTVMSIES